MKIGVTLPQTDMAPDRDSVTAFTQGVERLGYAHITAFEHVLGVDTEVHVGWNERGIPWSIYDVDSTFHEPFVLYGYLAAITSLELVTGILVLPQRQTALVAKQAAEVDILSGGKLRLGVAVGWNDVEYAALGQDFGDRGKRFEEQLELLRLLWTTRSVTFKGASEQVTAAGIAPLPIQRPIPIWLGAESTRAYQRVGRLADGWFPQIAPGARLDAALEIIGSAATDVDRDPKTIAMEGRVTLGTSGVAKLVERIGKWEAAGATHVSVNTIGSGFTTVDEHLEIFAAVAAEVLS